MAQHDNFSESFSNQKKKELENSGFLNPMPAQDNSWRTPPPRPRKIAQEEQKPVEEAQSEISGPGYEPRKQEASVSDISEFTKTPQPPPKVKKIEEKVWLFKDLEQKPIPQMKFEKDINKKEN